MKTLALLFFSLLIPRSIFPQTHALYAGYGFNKPVTTAVLGHTFSPSTKKVVFTISTYSAGNTVYGGYSLYLSHNIGIDLLVGKLIGSDETIFSSQSSLIKYTSSNVFWSPSITLKTDIRNISPFMKFGASVNYIEVNIKEQLLTADRSLYEERSKNDYTVGLFASLGVRFLVTDNVFVYSEALFNSVTFYPSETALYRNGVHSITFYPKESLPSASGGYSVSDAASAFPFSNLVLSLGVGVTI
jgi:hypothetical protein